MLATTTLSFVIMTMWTIGGWLRLLWSPPGRAAELREPVRRRARFLLGLAIWLALLFAIDLLHTRARWAVTGVNGVKNVVR